MTECFPREADKYGWCGTCQAHAKPGMPGYCNGTTTKPNSHAKDERVKVKPNKFWGFCRGPCVKTKIFPDNLKEVKLDIFPRAECSRSGASMDINTTIEICAGNRVLIQ